MKTTIAVAVSGGVDSLVAAHFLKSRGHRIFGIHFATGYERKRPESDRLAVLREHIAPIGAQLDIPIHVVDCANEFQKIVVDYFVDSYRKGFTPNPCLICNPAIKFGILLSHAQKLGACRLATGHYAKLETDDSKRFRLFRGRDGVKDQSYFLGRLTQRQLSAACFPLGDITKKEVRHLAKSLRLDPVASDESQDVCFIREKSYADFLSENFGSSPLPGPITDTEGNLLGQHPGLHHFTIGQRRGINCPASAPYYVVRIEPEENRLVVGTISQVTSPSCRVSGINWIQTPDVNPMNADVQIRYRHRACPAEIHLEDRQTATVIFKAPQPAVAPGQGAVFYKGNEVLGAGWIEKPI